MNLKIRQYFAINIDFKSYFYDRMIYIFQCTKDSTIFNNIFVSIYEPQKK